MSDDATPTAAVVISKRHMLAGWHYQFGTPDVRGDWFASAHKAGFDRKSPSPGSAAALEGIAAAAELHILATDAPQDADMDAIQQAIEDGDHADWATLGPLARRVLGKAASGRIKATSQQVAALKEIITRAEGKAGERRQDAEEAVGIVIMPSVVHDGIPVIDLSTVTRAEED